MRTSYENKNALDGVPRRKWYELGSGDDEHDQGYRVAQALEAEQRRRVVLVRVGDGRPTPQEEQALADADERVAAIDRRRLACETRISRIDFGGVDREEKLNLEVELATINAERMRAMHQRGRVQEDVRRAIRGRLLALHGGAR